MFSNIHFQWGGFRWMSFFFVFYFELGILVPSLPCRRPTLPPSLNILEIPLRVCFPLKSRSFIPITNNKVSEDRYFRCVSSPYNIFIQQKKKVSV